MPSKKIESGLLQRSFALDSREVDADSRTIELAFSSETRDVERWFGTEILDHSPSAIRLGRLKNGGPLLLDHDHRDLVGVVEGVEIGTDRMGRAKVRFGRSGKADEVFTDVQDGIRRHVSVGYRVHKMILESRSDDGDEVYRVTDWEPYEISLVSVPADPSVGIGRTAGETFPIQIEDESMTKQVEQSGAPEETRAAESVNIDAIQREANERANARVSEMLAIGQMSARFGGIDLAQRFIKDSKSPEQLRAAILERLPKHEDIGSGSAAPATKLDLSSKEVQRYSLMKAIRAADKMDWKGAEFELECSQAIADELGREARGFFVPLDIQQRSSSDFTMTKTTTDELVGTDHLAQSFIEFLRPNAVVMRLGATMLTGLVGDVDIPAQAGTATFYWLADDGDVTDSQVDMRTVSLSPKTVAGSVPMSRRLLKQSAPSVEMLIQRDLAVGAGLAIDLAAIQGSASNNQPRGIVNVSGVNTQSVAATSGVPTWAELVGFESEVASDNALTGNLAYVTTSPIVGGLKTTSKDSGSGLFLMEGGQANGYPVAVRNGITAKRIVFGNWSDVLIGMWGVLDVMPDRAAKAASGGLVLRVFQDIDVAVRHAESFCINAS
jgi:HK97 family phage major capsid protein/HK97 family phage prohead protease